MTKDKLLAVGERYEAMIAADKAADARVPIDAGARSMLVEILFYVFASILVVVGARHDHGAQPGARGAAAGAVLLHQRVPSGC